MGKFDNAGNSFLFWVVSLSAALLLQGLYRRTPSKRLRSFYAGDGLVTRLRDYHDLLSSGLGDECESVRLY